MMNGFGGMGFGAGIGMVLVVDFVVLGHSCTDQISAVLNSDRPPSSCWKR